jgi:hypothetical protein
VSSRYRERPYPLLVDGYSLQEPILGQFVLSLNGANSFNFGIYTCICLKESLITLLEPISVIDIDFFYTIVFNSINSLLVTGLSELRKPRSPDQMKRPENASFLPIDSILIPVQFQLTIEFSYLLKIVDKPMRLC